MEDKIVSREIIVSSLKAEGFRLGHNRSSKSKNSKKAIQEKQTSKPDCALGEHFTVFFFIRTLFF